MAKPELGNKHQCQNCGARFFDLKKSPIRCPKCGTVCQAAPLPLVAHHATGSSLRAKSRFRTAAVADDEEPPAGAETVLVSLDEADAGEDKVAVVADDDVEIEAGDEFSSRRRKRMPMMSATSSMARSETKKNADVWLVKRDA